MADVDANIHIRADVVQAKNAIKGLTQQLNAFNAAANLSNRRQLSGIQNIANDIKNAAANTKLFTAEFEKVRTSASILDKTLARGRGTLSQYFDAKFVKNGTTYNRVLDLANERARVLSSSLLMAGQSSKGFQESLRISNVSAFNDQLQVSAQRQQLLSNLFRQGTTQLINFGKNTQWAGRQLMVGFTVPLTILGSTAGKVFMELEQQAVYFKRVYGDVFTTTEQTQQNLDSVMELAEGFTKYGIAVKDTLALAGQVAAAGRRDVELRDAVIQATRLATLGQMEQNTALKATIALQSAFQISGNELAQTIDFLNAVENQTVVSLEDISQAIPRVAPVVRGLGGDVKDLTVFLAAMQEGGVSAEQGANALKSGLASLVNPTKAATETLKGFNINLDSIIQTNRGDLMGLVMDFGQALQGLDMFSRQQALEKVFGKYQYARLGALFENIGREGSQAAQVIDLMKYSTAELANLSDRELSRIEEAYGTKLKAAIEEFKLSIAPIGEMFVRAATPFIKFAAAVANAFNNLPDGIKNIIGFGTILVGLIVPTFLMFSGLLFNLIGQLLKFGQNFALVGKGMISGGFPQALKLIGQSANYASLEELKSADAAKQLSMSTEAANTSLRKQSYVLESVTKQFKLLNTELVLAFANQDRLAASMGKGGMSPSIAARKSIRSPKKMATGGMVPGSGNQDTIPTLLTPGEFVINKDASQKYAPFLQSINKGAVAQYATGLNAYEQKDMNPGYRISQDKTGRVSFRDARGKFASENIAVKANILAAKAAENFAAQTNKTTNTTAKYAGRISMASGAIGSVAMMSSIMSSGQNEFANKMMIAGMGLSMLSSVVVGMKSGIAAAAVVVVASLYAIQKSNEAQVKKGIELGNAMTLTTKNIKSMGDYFGNKSNYQKQLDKMFTGNRSMNELLTEGKNFLESEQGKTFLKEVENIRKTTEGSFAKTRDAIGTKLAQAVASGLMSQDQAQSISYALGQQLKDTNLGFAIAGTLTSIVGPNGEDLTKTPMQVALTLNSNSSMEINNAKEKVGELGSELEKISAFWSGRADEARRSIGLLIALQNSGLVTQRENIANVITGYDVIIEKMKQTGDQTGAELLEQEKLSNVTKLQKLLEDQRKDMFKQFLPDAKDFAQYNQDLDRLEKKKLIAEENLRKAEQRLTRFDPKTSREQYNKTLQEIKQYKGELKSIQTLQNQTIYNTEKFDQVQSEMFTGLGDSIKSLYGDTPIIKEFLKLTEGQTLANANLRISVNAGTIDPQIAALIAQEMGETSEGKKTFNRLFSLDFVTIGEEAATSLAKSYLTMDEEQRKEFSLLIEQRGGNEVLKLVPLLEKVVNYPSLINLVLSIDTDKMTTEDFTKFQEGLTVIDEFPDLIGKEVVIKDLDKKDIMNIDTLYDKLVALKTVDEKYQYVIDSNIFGADSLVMFQEMWSSLKDDPKKVLQFMAIFSTGSTKISDLIQEREALFNLKPSPQTGRRIKQLNDEIADVEKGMLIATKATQDFNQATKEDGDGERKVSALEYLKALLELKMKGLDPAAAAQLEQLEAVQLSEQVIGKQIQSIKSLNEEQRIAAMTTEALKDENQRLSDTLTVSSALIDSQVKQLERTSIKPVQETIDVYQKTLDKITKKEDAINKRYEDRVKALDAVERANERLAAQQQNQIDLAGALTSGDFGTAARAAAEMTSAAAGYQLEDAKLALEEQKQVDINNITEEVNGKLMTRVQIQDQINAQQERLVQLEKEKTVLVEKQFKIQTLSQLMSVVGEIRNSANRTQRDMLLTQAQSMGTTLGISNIQGAGAFGGLSKELGIDLSAISVEITSAVQTSQKSIQELAGHTKSVGDSFKLSASLFKKAETEASNSLSFMTGISSLWGDRKSGLVATGADIYATFKSAKDAISKGVVDINNAKQQALAAIASASSPKKKTQTGMYGGLMKYMTGGMVNYKGSREPAPGMNYGGKMKKYAVGSMVPGVGITDKVPALLTPGEFVVRKSVTQANLPLLEALNGNVFPSMNSEGMEASPVLATSNVSNISAPMYNYSVNVNVADTNASANEIANVVINKIKMTQDRGVRGNRY